MKNRVATLSAELTDLVFGIFDLFQTWLAVNFSEAKGQENYANYTISDCGLQRI